MTSNATADTRGYIVKVGDKAPDFELEMVDGSKSMLSDHRGKVVMLQFTASWCSVCRTEMPVIEKEIWQEFKEQNFILIGVDKGEPVEVVKDFRTTVGTTYPLALDVRADYFGLYAQKSSGVTRNVIVDSEGNIAFLTRLFQRAEFDEMKAVIKELLV